MADAQEVLDGLLEKGLNFPKEKIASLKKEDGSLVDDAETQILEHQAAAATAARKSNGAALQAKKDEGARIAGEKWEKRLKEAGIPIGSATDEEAFELIKAHLAELAAKHTEKVDPKDEASIKTSKVYLNRERELLGQLEAEKLDRKKELDERDARDAQAAIMRSVNSMKEQVFADLKPIMPEGAKGDKQKRLVDLDIAQYTFEPDGDDFIAKWATGDKKGERVDTPQGHPVKAKDLLADIVKNNFDLPAATAKTSAGDVTKNSTKTGAIGNGALKKPANDKEYTDMLHAIDVDPTRSIEQRITDKREVEKVYRQTA